MTTTPFVLMVLISLGTPEDPVPKWRYAQSYETKSDCEYARSKKPNGQTNFLCLKIQSQTSFDISVGFKR